MANLSACKDRILLCCCFTTRGPPSQYWVMSSIVINRNILSQILSTSIYVLYWVSKLFLHLLTCGHFGHIITMLSKPHILNVSSLQNKKKRKRRRKEAHSIAVKWPAIITSYRVVSNKDNPNTAPNICSWDSLCSPAGPSFFHPLSSCEATSWLTGCKNVPVVIWL